MISGCMYKSMVCSQRYAWRKPVLRHNSEVNKYGASSATLLYNGCNCLEHKLQHLATVQLFTTQQLNQHWIHNCLRRSALPAASSETVQQQTDGSFTLLSILSSLYLAGKLAKDLYRCMRRYVTRNALRYSSVQSGGLGTVLQRKDLAARLFTVVSSQVTPWMEGPSSLMEGYRAYSADLLCEPVNNTRTVLCTPAVQ